MTTDSKSDMSQIPVVGEPPPKSWKDYRQGCHSTFAGGYHKKETRLAFRHGMETVFNLLEAEFPPAELCQAAPDLLEACKAMLGMAAIWNVDPSKSQNTMNTAFAALRDAIAEATGEAIRHKETI